MKFLVAILFTIAFASAQTLTDFQANDIKTLNFALSLEHLEYTFYVTGLNNLTVTDFTNAGYNTSVYNFITLIRDYEGTHVNLLTSAIVARGGTPVPYCTYTFPYSTVPEFLYVAHILENTGVMAYDGAIDTITELYLQTAAATIATVEGRFSAYLNNLIGLSPFPSPFDNATSPDDIVNMIQQFIVSCNVTPPIPQPATFPENTPMDNTTAYLNDIKTLNFALNLEDLENNFYLQGLATFNASDFVAAGYNASLYDYIEMVSMHETTHANFLRSTLGSAARQPCTYNFGFGTDVNAFLTLARTFENTGVSAYDGAINTITDLTYRTAAATIATVEARHASYLNLVTGFVPFPNSTDPTLSGQQVLNMVAPYIVSCPNGNPDIPVPANFSSAAQAGPAVITTSSMGSSSSTSGVINHDTTTSAATSVSMTMSLMFTIVFAAIAFFLNM